MALAEAFYFAAPQLLCLMQMCLFRTRTHTLTRAYKPSLLVPVESLSSTSYVDFCAARQSTPPAPLHISFIFYVDPLTC